MKKIVMLLYLVTGWSAVSFSQKDLDIDDIVPDEVYAYLKNHVTGTGAGKSYKGKNIILNFWNLYCFSCTTGMPEDERIQREVGDSLTLIMVTGDKRPDIIKQFKKYEIPMPRLDFITSDTFLKKYFPYIGVPYLVWINAKGRVAHMTYGDKLTVENIRAFVSGEKLDMGYAKTEFESFNSSIPIIKNERVVDYLINFSILTRELKGVTGGAAVRRLDSTGVSVAAVNCRLIDLYRYAYGGFQNCRFNEFDGVKVLTADSSVLYQRFCYELKLPLDRSYEWQLYMREDLSRFFRFDISENIIGRPTLFISGKKANKTNYKF